MLHDRYVPPLAFKGTGYELFMAAVSGGWSAWPGSPASSVASTVRDEPAPDEPST